MAEAGPGSMDAGRVLDDEKWRRALLKKLRAAVGVKTRLDAGDAGALQKTQVGKGQRKTIRELLSKLKDAGLPRESAEVEAAYEAGAREGKAAMEAAKRRGPDGGADGTTPSNKAMKRERQAKAREDRTRHLTGETSAGGGGGGKNGGTRRSDQRAQPADSTNPAGTSRRENERRQKARDDNRVSGHQVAACKRAVLALHALAKTETPPGRSAAVAAVAALTTPSSLVAAADARTVSTAMWALAKVSAGGLGRREDDAETTKGGPVAETDDAIGAVEKAAAALAARAGAVASDMDARGLSTALWSLATFASPSSSLPHDRVPPAMAPAAATAAGRPVLKALGSNPVVAAACNAQDAANALWGCAKLRLAPSPHTVDALVAAMVSGRSGGSSIPAKPLEMSMALWGLASLHADGILPGDGPSAAAPLVRLAASAAAAAPEAFSPQAVANTAWAAGKLSGGAGRIRSGTDASGGGGGSGDSSGNRTADGAELEAACTSLVDALAGMTVAAPPGAFTAQGLANVLWACAAVGASKALASSLVHRVLNAATAAGRKATAKAAGLASAAAIEAPSGDDVAAALEAADRLGVVPDGDTRKAIRAAVSAALAPGPTPGNRTGEGRETVGWQAAGRMEHALFRLLGLGDAASAVPRPRKGEGTFGSDDVALAERLLRRGAAAVDAANDLRLTLEEGAAAALLEAGQAGPVAGGGAGRILCVDDTHRLLSQPLREAGWKVTPWNRFTRRERAGAPWPSKQKVPFDAATVRLPPTKGAFEMATAAAAARLTPGATLWVYGAASEGVHTAAESLPERLFTDARVVFATRRSRGGTGQPGGGFAVLSATRTEAEAEAKDDAAAWRTTVDSLRLPAGAGRAGGAEGGKTMNGWVVYPGLFAGGGLDVMTAALLRAMPASLPLGDAPAVLDFCSGSGVLAAAMRDRVPRARVTLLDADAVALLASRENLAPSAARGGASSNPGEGGFTFVQSDGWAGLEPGETFDLIVSNPPVHLGLQPEFTVLASLVGGARARLKPGGAAWLVAQRYVPVGAVCAAAGEGSARCVAVDDRFAVWCIDKDRDEAGAGSDSRGGEEQESKKAKKAKKAKKEKKEKKEKEGKKEK